MNKIFRCLSLVLVLVMMMSMTTFAASISAPTVNSDKELRTVKVSGTVAEPNENQQVVILVLESTANLQSVSDDDIAYIDQITAEDDGKYEFNFAIDESKGDKFKAYIGGTGVTSPQPATINLGQLGGPGDCAGLKVADGGPGPDGEVGLADYVFIISNYKKSVYNSDAKLQEQLMIADFNNNQTIDLGDYVTVISNYKKSYK